MIECLLAIQVIVQRQSAAVLVHHVFMDLIDFICQAAEAASHSVVLHQLQ